MNSILAAHISSTLAATRPKVLVVGDIMLDHYRIASATRISPEAPVPVLLNPIEEYRLGGAGAVAAMCAALGAEVALLGVIGEDGSGARVLELLQTAGVTFCGEFSASRRTTTKERICAIASGRHRQQLARIDSEVYESIPDDVARVLQDTIDSLSQASGDRPDITIIADYAKGLCVDQIVQTCRNTGTPTLVDPPKGIEWSRYNGVTCVVPNREEAGSRTARDLMRQLSLTAAVVKLDVDGCQIQTREPGRAWDRIIPARARTVHDVTGAGDQFIATLAIARAAQIDWLVAAELANLAAGLQVERHGCVPVTTTELLKELSRDAHGTANSDSPASPALHSNLAAAG